MTQSPKLHFFKSFRGEDKQKKVPLIAPKQPDNVEGWLMNVHTYRKEDILTTIVDADNNSISIESPGRNRKGRPGSIASEDSVNLDELINANFTTDMDDETDLPDLADLDLDDSTDDFWSLDKTEQLNTLNTSFGNYITSKSINNNYGLDWSPTENNAINLKTSLPVTPSSEENLRLIRSGSVSSENSLNSQSTITQYAKYGLTPVIYPSESSSTSSRSLSRLSNYSAASSTTTTGIPRPRTNSAAGNHSGIIPTASRSSILRDTKNNSSNNSNPVENYIHKGSASRTPLAKRASHIPAPSNYNTSPPMPQRTTSSSSANSLPNTTRLRLPTTAQQQQQQQKKTMTQRASHIPTVRESIHRPGSPLQSSIPGRSATPTRMGMRSPTPRHSLFPPSHKSSATQDKSTKKPSYPEENKGATSPTNSRPSGLRPPGSSVPSSLRSPSRIGTLKRSL